MWRVSHREGAIFQEESADVCSVGILSADFGVLRATFPIAPAAARGSVISARVS